MKLLLTSNGFTNESISKALFELTEKKPQDTSLVFIPTASNVENVEVGDKSWFIDDLIPTKLESHEAFSLTWVTAKELLTNWKLHNGNKDVDHWIYFLKKSITHAKELGYDTTSRITS